PSTGRAGRWRSRIGEPPMPFNRELVVEYARKWALSENPNFYRYGDDCTNFVSQCLLAGGWTMVGTFEHRKDDNVWWCDVDGHTFLGCLAGHNASYTWAGAQNFYNFLQATQRGTQVPDWRELDRGDVIQLQTLDDDHVHHSMV